MGTGAERANGEQPGNRHGTRVIEVLREATDAIVDVLGALDDWGLAGTRSGQYTSDLAADSAALAVLQAAGLGVLSEESGRHRPTTGDPRDPRDPDDESVEADAPASGIVVVVDPLDGSTNASRGIPWYATSLCAVDDEGPLAAVVTNLVSKDRFEAVRGGGAWCNGEPIRPSGCVELRRALVGLSGYPPRYLGWKQFRALGAAALDLCAVANGTTDAYVDCSHDAHGSWDYLGGMLVCQEAGASIVDASGRDLVVLDHAARRTPVAAATSTLLDELVEARRSF